MRRLIGWLLIAVTCLLLPPVTPTNTPPPVAAAVPGVVGEYLILTAPDQPLSSVRAAISVAGGQIVRENTAIGLATVRVDSHSSTFLRLIRQHPAITAATPNIPFGQIQGGPLAAKPAREVEPGERPDGGSNGGPLLSSDPLSSLQWDMQVIEATATTAHATQAGDPRVLVGVIDSGIDGNHPDLAANFDRTRSRNFVTDIPDLDGSCTYASCIDPPDEDGNGHGTHVAGTIAAASNGLGIVGVAPRVSLVNLRAGQDSGLFLLQPTVDALTYAGDIGINVVNMSYYIDPWLYNCLNNPADNPEAQQAQRTTLEATQRALDYAQARGVVLVSAAGNGHSDLDNVTVDTVSPNFPPGAAYQRQLDQSCRSMPSDGTGVISVTATGPSGRKAYYSDYGLHHADIAAPGGDSLDYAGTPQYQPVKNRILSTYPQALLVASGEIDAQGQLTPRAGQAVVRDCRGETCAYYRYYEGTSMAAPHVTGVVALIVSQYGTAGLNRPGTLRLSPARVEQILQTTATPQPCPAQNPFPYPGPTANAQPRYTARCEGTERQNGFYGVGIVNANRAVGR